MNSYESANVDGSLDLSLKATCNLLVTARGQLILPALPSMLESYMDRIKNIFVVAGKPMSDRETEDISKALERRLDEAYNDGPNNFIVVEYGPSPKEAKGKMALRLSTKAVPLEDHYRQWQQKRADTMFGKHADARVVALAEELVDSNPSARALDIGAGTGRNSIYLAGKGIQTDALEMTPAFVQQLRSASSKQNIPLVVSQANVMDPLVQFPAASYHLIVISEVLTHFRSSEQLNGLIKKAADALAPSGKIVFNAIVADSDYVPSSLALELSSFFWACLFTRPEVEGALKGADLTLDSEVDAAEYEKEHLPAEAWPPTPWYEHWAMGRNIFQTIKEPPVRLKWFVCHRES